MRKGIFVISLDFELYWGVRDHRTLNNYGSNIANVHSVVPALLSLFAEHGIHCTWATVGFMFCKDITELKNNLPNTIPAYKNPALNPYGYIRESSQMEEKFHFAPHLISKILATPGQEIGTHTLSHYYSLESGTNFESFDSDIQQAIQLAETNNIKINSIVFPRNQYNDQFLEVCAKYDIKVFRGTEKSWIYNTRSRAKETKLRRVIRLMDSYLNLSGYHTHRPSRIGVMINIPASRFLRPYNPKLVFLEALRLNRIKKSMKHAAQRGEIFHLWWHPHNFGSYTDENLSFLNKIITYYKHLEQKYDMRSLNMREIADSIK